MNKQSILLNLLPNEFISITKKDISKEFEKTFNL